MRTMRTEKEGGGLESRAGSRRLVRALPALTLASLGSWLVATSSILEARPAHPQEKEVMMTHPVIGAKLLSGSTSKFLQMGEQIALVGVLVGAAAALLWLKGQLVKRCADRQREKDA